MFRAWDGGGFWPVSAPGIGRSRQAVTRALPSVKVIVFYMYVPSCEHTRVPWRGFLGGPANI